MCYCCLQPSLARDFFCFFSSEAVRLWPWIGMYGGTGLNSSSDKSLNKKSSIGLFSQNNKIRFVQGWTKCTTIKWNVGTWRGKGYSRTSSRTGAACGGVVTRRRLWYVSTRVGGIYCHGNVHMLSVAGVHWQRITHLQVFWICQPITCQKYIQWNCGLQTKMPQLVTEFQFKNRQSHRLNRFTPPISWFTQYT